MPKELAWTGNANGIVATPDMTEDVGIDENGQLKITPRPTFTVTDNGDGTVNLNITTK